jgi:predicted acyl esterase
MKLKEFQELTGLQSCPSYWDKRYVKNLDKLSKPIYTMEIEHDVEIVLRDGCKIYADVYHPAEIENAPVLLAWSPYGKEMQATQHGAIPSKSNYFDHCHEAGDYEFFVKRGYTFIIPNPRGIGASEGEFLGIYNPTEQLDVYDVIEWAGTDCQWGNGKVGMHGYSYFGIIQPLVAALQPPHLSCIFPLSYQDDYYQHAYYGGVQSTYMYMYWENCPAVNPVTWSSKMWSEEEMKMRMQERKEDPDIAVNSYFTRILNQWPARYHTFYLDVLLHPQRDEFWNQRSAKLVYDKIKVPAYIKCSWTPLGRFSAPVFNAISSKKLDTFKRIGVLEGYNALRLPYRFMDPECLRWYDCWMKDIDMGFNEEPAIKINILGKGIRYEKETEWPLPRTEFKELYLHTFGEMNWDKCVDGNLPPDSFTHMPPHITTEVDSLVYRTERMTQPTEFTGPVELKLYASIDAEEANFCVKLWQITPDGSRMPLCRTGSLKTCYDLIPEESSPGLPVHDYTKKVLNKPGEIKEYVIEINPIGMVFSPGCCIELEIKAMDNYAPQSGAYDGKMANLGYVPSANTVSYKIYRDKDHASHLLMPHITDSPEDSWLQPLVDDDVVLIGNGSGNSH